MMPATTGIHVRLLLISWIFGALVACGDAPESAEAGIRAWVADGQRRVEEKDKNALVDMISQNYRDARGNGRDDVENMFRLYFLRQNAIELLVKIDDIRVFGDTAAELDLTVGMAGTNEGVLGFSASAYQFELELVRDDDEWLLIAGRWAEIGDAPH